MYNKIVRPSLKTKKWEKFRDKILRKYNYLCQESLRYGISEPAEMVHHIFPVSEYPELEFQEWNCLPLTNKRHNTFHDRKNDKVIGQGIFWQKKRKKEFLNFYKNRKMEFCKNRIFSIFQFLNFSIIPPSKKIFLERLGTGEGNFFQVGGLQTKRG